MACMCVEELDKLRDILKHEGYDVDLIDSMKFCAYCGKKLPLPCPHCGAEPRHQKREVSNGN